MGVAIIVEESGICILSYFMHNVMNLLGVCMCVCGGGEARDT